MFTFVEAPVFTEQVLELWTDEEYADFQQFLASSPELETSSRGSAAFEKYVGRPKVGANAAEHG